MGFLYLGICSFNLFFSYRVYRFFYPKKARKNSHTVKDDVEFLKDLKNVKEDFSN